MKKDKYLQAKFPVIIDTREQTPWVFSGIIHQRIPVTIRTVVQKLKTGDYSLHPYADQFAVERKSPQDLVNTVCRGRDRFERELARLDAMEFGCVIVEEQWKELMVWCAENTRYSPVSLDSSILAWNQRFKNVQWYFRPGRYAAMKTAFKLMDRWWRDHQ